MGRERSQRTDRLSRAERLLISTFEALDLDIGEMFRDWLDKCYTLPVTEKIDAILYDQANEIVTNASLNLERKAMQIARQEARTMHHIKQRRV